MTTTVVKMEDSGEHKKIYQKFKRLAETKKDELAYKYNPVRKQDDSKQLLSSPGPIAQVPKSLGPTKTKSQ